MVAGLLALATGCGVDREFTIRTVPAAADLKIDSLDHGRSPVLAKLHFDDDKSTHELVASHVGYKTAHKVIVHDDPDEVVVPLERESRRLTINVTPAAQITVEGLDEPKRSTGLVSTFTPTLPFTVDEHGQWTTYKITAAREGWEPASTTATWSDPDSTYRLKLEPLHKIFHIVSVPGGATIYLNDKEIGVSPLTKEMSFSIDPQSDLWNQYHFRAQKAGYDGADQIVSWDNGKTEYSLPLKIKQKDVRIMSSPPGAVIMLEGLVLERDAAGTSVVHLAFPPDDQGRLPSYTLNVTKEMADTKWYPTTTTIGWDQGKLEYVVPLKEIVEWPVELLSAVTERKSDGWYVLPKRTQVLAMKSLVDAGVLALKGPAQRVRTFADLGQLDTLAISPDGSLLVAALLSAQMEDEFHAQLVAVKSDGSGGCKHLTDGLSLDLNPCFTPDGKQIVFSSNRGGRRLNIWSLWTSGAGGITSLASGDTTDLFPCVDETRHLYYQVLVDNRPDPRIFQNELGRNSPTDLIEHGGMRPQVNAAADTLLYVAVNAKTGKREIFKKSLKDELTTNLTNSPETDNFDPAWSPSGDRIAFVTDRGADLQGRHNLDVWIMDPNRPDQAFALTNNGSQDDCPVWDTKDPTGSAVYFRSNRGGVWAIWRAQLKEAPHTATNATP
jgi:hypothetical protein